MKSLRNKDTDGHAPLFNKTAINIFKNYIPNKYVVFNDKDLPWLNDHRMILIKKRNVILQREVFNVVLKSSNANYTNLQTRKVELTHAINLSKNQYFKCLGNKLNNTTTLSKTYWSVIIKTFVNEKKTFVISYLSVN